MKSLLIALAAASLMIPGAVSAQPLAKAPTVAARTEQLFDFGWRFQAGDPDGAQAPGFDDRTWRKLNLPHDFQIEQPWDQSASGGRGFKAMGTGWYRKSFKADPAWQGKKVLLDFEGLMLFGQVWVNGQKVADIDYGYLGAQADISKVLNYGGDNVVAVRASTGRVNQSRWYTGGGLFRDVHLVVKNPISIAQDGVFITTPKIGADAAEVGVQVEIDGITGQRLDLEIEARIFGPDGKLVAQTRSDGRRYAKLIAPEFKLPPASVPAPKLWSTDAPNLYTAKVAIRQDGKVLDEVTETFGIRTVEFSNTFGLRINGQKVFLKGIANHHDLGALGAATSDKAIERLFIQLKKFGFNHVRLSHNPYSRSFTRLADKYGIIIVDELADKWSDGEYWPGARPFTQMWYEIVPAWIKRDRNHPSVILWSLGNELQMREDLTGFPGTSDWGVTTYRILDVLAKRYDPTRPTTVAMFPSRAEGITRHDPEFSTWDRPPELATVTDVSSFNYQAPTYAKYLQYAPHMIVYQSEAGTSDLTGNYYLLDHEKMVGLAYWGGVEYWGESNAWPKKGWNYSFFNHALEPYPQAYLMKSAFQDDPLVYIGVVDGQAEAMNWNDVLVGRQPVSSHWNRTAGGKYNLFTYTNADEVELFVNGRSQGVQRNDRANIKQRNIIFWKNVPYGEGGDVTAVARTAGKEVARQRLETTGAPVALRIEPEDGPWKADGLDLQYVKVRALDAKGRVVPTAANPVTFEVAGGAKLIAVDNGDHATDELFSGDRRAMHDGFVMAILRAGQTAGPVTLKVSSPGLKGAQVRLRTVGQ